ncbi:MAG: hypothetical protein FWH11_05830 [Micrococcales bacterium]|nr:hypothetical protein [Micrococcales bacterium]
MPERSAWGHGLATVVDGGSDDDAVVDAWYPGAPGGSSLTRAAEALARGAAPNPVRRP